MESDDSYSYSYSYSRSPSPARGGARSPPPDEPRPRAASAVLAVSNLTLDVTIAHLREIFELFGPVSTVELAIDRAAGLPKGYAYVGGEKFGGVVDAQKYSLGASKGRNSLCR